MRSRSVIATCLLLPFAAACGGYTPPSAVHRRAMPQPALCQKIPPKIVRDALGGKITNCATEALKHSFGARFSATARGVPMALIVSYEFRYDQLTGFDQWELYSDTSKTRVSFLGVGEDAVYDAGRAILTAVARNLIITVGIQAGSGGRVPTGELPEHLLAVMQAALDLDTPPRAATPGQSPTSA
ncbi:MAG: hypothetical protein ABIS86_14075 [Streptosporangiaceae bacterium]